MIARDVDARSLTTILARFSGFFHSVITNSKVIPERVLSHLTINASYMSALGILIMVTDGTPRLRMGHGYRGPNQLPGRSEIELHFSKMQFF